MKIDKSVLKALREARKERIDILRTRLKEQNRKIKGIKAETAGDGKTVPEIAAALDLPTAEVLWYLMALKKYGEIGEGDKEGDYFRYKVL